MKSRTNATDSCDDLLFSGERRGVDDPKASSMSHAWKIRSALTYLYAFEGKRGRIGWNRETRTGNPSLSYLVQYYYKSLDRRKVQDHGERPTPARAITVVRPGSLQFHLPSSNLSLGHHARLPTHHRRTGLIIHPWLGPTLRIMLHAMYTLSFVCFLRFDETLRLKAHNIEFSYDSDTRRPVMTITLDWRKTDQTGHIKPFVIPALPSDKSHICPVRWMSKWLTHSKIKSGFVFQKLTRDHEVQRLRPDALVGLSAQQFILYFRNTLVDIDVFDVYAYGAHSFRRGGVQYCNAYLAWPIRDIVQWGGWSTNFNSKTVHLYLISWNDDEVKSRKSFWLLGNSDSPPTCSHCGR
ncbi:hypothetical protein BDZ89DRAFT_962861 [Hymenopellis radicata]|nr:hypothetical protein BDZ89DRAFT_962861 [Hymenopellis radicata]